MYTKESFESNSELTKYAQEKYGITLDGRSSMDSLLEDLNKAAIEHEQKQNPPTPPEPQKPKTEKKPKDKKPLVFRDDPIGKGLALLHKRRGG